VIIEIFELSLFCELMNEGASFANSWKSAQIGGSLVRWYYTPNIHGKDSGCDLVERGEIVVNADAVQSAQHHAKHS